MANDPNTIQYVIQEDGFWYVASKEKNPYVPELTVSAKGIANGLSTEYNDGWDFGPDSYDPDSTASIPYTQTLGIHEAVNYIVSAGGGEILIKKGLYDLTNSPVHESSVSGVNPYIIGIPYVNASSELVPIYIHGELNTSTFMEALAPIDTQQDTIIYSGNTTTTPTDLIQAIPNPSGSAYETGIHLILDRIHLRTHAGGYVNALNAFYAVSLTIGNISLDVDSTTGSPPLGNQTGIICPQFGPGSQSYTTLSSITAMGYYVGISAGGNTSIGVYNIDYIFYGLSLDAPKYSVVAEYINVQNCAYAVRSTIASGSYINLKINSMVFGDQSGLPYAYNSSGNWGIVYDPNNTIYGKFTAIPYPSTGMPPAGPSWFVANAYQLRARFIQPGTPASISTNPPVSATVYQNTNPYPIEIDLPVYATTAGTAGYVTIAKGASSSSLTTIGNQYVSGDTSDTSEQIIRLRVPAGWYYEFTASGVTFGTASVFAD